MTTDWSNLTFKSKPLAELTRAELQEAHHHSAAGLRLWSDQAIAQGGNGNITPERELAAAIRVGVIEEITRRAEK